jgi:hypothetical protein
MRLQKEISDMRLSFEPLTLYQKFEHICVMVLTALIAIIIVLALWNLTLKILLSIVATNFDPTDSAAILALGAVYWPVREQERRRDVRATR